MPSGDPQLSDYLSNLAGHPLRVVRTSDGVFDLLRNGAPVFYCERQWLPGRRDPVLLISRLHLSDSDAAALQGDTVTVLAFGKLPHLSLEYRGGTATASVWRRDGAAYLADVAAPGWQPGTTRLVDEESGAPVQVAVSVDFGDGFAEITERSDGHYFRWSNGPDGQAQFDLVNALDRPLTVRFQAILHIDPALPSGSFDLTTPAGKESIRTANMGVLDRVWTLQPGSNPVIIKCHEHRIPSPNDRRYIVFGLWDWAVIPVGSPQASE